MNTSLLAAYLALILHKEKGPRQIVQLPLQMCTFRVDYTLENIPGREFGSVFVGPTSENVALRVVSEGWAKVN